MTHSLGSTSPELVLLAVRGRRASAAGTVQVCLDFSADGPRGCEERNEDHLCSPVLAHPYSKSPQQASRSSRWVRLPPLLSAYVSVPSAEDQMYMLCAASRSSRTARPGRESCRGVCVADLLSADAVLPRPPWSTGHIDIPLLPHLPTHITWPVVARPGLATGLGWWAIGPFWSMSYDKDGRSALTKAHVVVGARPTFQIRCLFMQVLCRADDGDLDGGDENERERVDDKDKVWDEIQNETLRIEDRGSHFPAQHDVDAVGG